MSTGEAIAGVQFWLDQHADWFTDREVVLGLNRAVSEWVQTRYATGLSTEQSRAELIHLIPTPIQGSGSRVVINDTDNVLYVLAVDVAYRGADGVLGLPRPCQPVSRDAAAVALNSIFKAPTNLKPLYVWQRQTAGFGQVLDIISPSPPDVWRVHYLKKPMPLSETRKDEVWAMPDHSALEVIQLTARMLLQAKAPDYAAQTQVETPMASSLKGMAP